MRRIARAIEMLIIGALLLLSTVLSIAHWLG